MQCPYYYNKEKLICRAFPRDFSPDSVINNEYCSDKYKECPFYSRASDKNNMRSFTIKKNNVKIIV